VKLAYVFISDFSHQVLSTMILPQIESGRHGAEVVGMFFTQDRVYFLMKGTELGERIKKLIDGGMAAIACDQCTYERGVENNLIDGVTIGCFPDFLKALAEKGVDQVVTI
jgi:sulfur relay (sulfurtransferase) complex TusBCD TusD component (DsrE family)